MNRLGLLRSSCAILSLFAALGTGKAETEVEAPSPHTSEPTTNSVSQISTLSNASANAPVEVSQVSSLGTADLVEFPTLSPAIQGLLSRGLALTRQNLSYKYGSANPEDGGMDCSGTIYFLLGQVGLKEVPRDASGIYSWVWKKGAFQAVVSSNAKTFELSRLHPGDLLFWTGTYRVNRDPPVTHVMIYLGTSRLTDRRVMVGASDGRTFNDQPRFGVSVFDFKLTGSSSPEGSRFIGYSPIPGLESTRSTSAAAKSPNSSL